jgi:hypothetical protein
LAGAGTAKVAALAGHTARMLDPAINAMTIFFMISSKQELACE